MRVFFFFPPPLALSRRFEQGAPMAGLASKSQLRMSFLRYALVTVPALLLLGTLSGALSGAGSANLWFAALRKPPMMPPAWVFGAVWTLLYILIGLSLAMVLHA